MNSQEIFEFDKKLFLEGKLCIKYNSVAECRLIYNFLKDELPLIKWYSTSEIKILKNEFDFTSISYVPLMQIIQRSQVIYPFYLQCNSLFPHLYLFEFLE